MIEASATVAPIETTPNIRAERRPVVVWLVVVAIMVFAMVVIGGITRFTESGLSIVEWRPLTGILPPLTPANWQSLFEQYRATPEYRKLNFGMSIESFKAIFWWEYVHRLWGRLIGIVFLLPFLWFAWTGRIEPALKPRLVGLFVLGAAQGALGWWMVRSGLADDPFVSQYRLAAHLGLALIIYGALVWTAFDLTNPRAIWPPSAQRLRYGAGLVLLLIALTILAGAFMAGLDAGMIMNTFPLMGGRFVPEDLWLIEPPLWNLFENPVTVQFAHRLLGMTTVAAVLAAWWAIGRGPATEGARRAAGWTAAMALAQLGLGIATLLAQVPVTLGALHQAGAVVILTLALWTAHHLGRPAPPAPQRAAPRLVEPIPAPASSPAAPAP
jgi:cytochrome c oxidase assembly protein subunit 15